MNPLWSQFLGGLEGILGALLGVHLMDHLEVHLGFHLGVYWMGSLTGALQVRGQALKVFHYRTVYACISEAVNMSQHGIH